MYWWYKLLEKNGDVYRYAYSRESDICDGIIVYSATTQTAIIEKVSKTDRTLWEQQKSLEHFSKVIKEGFPKQRQVCCG